MSGFPPFCIGSMRPNETFLGEPIILVIPTMWVSEIMLQQTRTETVKDYYVRWMAAFPTVSALAQASEEEVLKLWQGLGYYSRARNLHKAAREIVLQYHGIFPRYAGGGACPARHR